MRVRVPSALLWSRYKRIVSQTFRTAWATSTKCVNMAFMPDNKYMREYMAERRKRRRETLLEMFGRQCLKCGATTDLEFDHRDRSTKLFQLSGCYLDGPWETIVKEAQKCDLLCYMCHLEKSGLVGDFGGGQNKIQDPEHGTAHMYTTYSCRCLDCKYAKMLYRAQKIDYLDQVQAPLGWRRGRLPR